MSKYTSRRDRNKNFQEPKGITLQLGQDLFSAINDYIKNNAVQEYIQAINKSQNKKLTIYLTFLIDITKRNKRSSNIFCVSAMDNSMEKLMIQLFDIEESQDRYIIKPNKEWLMSALSIIRVEQTQENAVALKFTGSYYTLLFKNDDDRTKLLYIILQHSKAYNKLLSTVNIDKQFIYSVSQTKNYNNIIPDLNTAVDESIAQGQEMSYIPQLSQSEIAELENLLKGDAIQGESLAHQLEKLTNLHQQDMIVKMVHWESTSDESAVAIFEQYDTTLRELSELDSVLNTYKKPMNEIGMSLQVITNQNSIVNFQQQNLDILKTEIESYIKKLDVPFEVKNALENLDGILDGIHKETDQYGEKAVQMGVEVAERERISANPNTKGKIEYLVYLNSKLQTLLDLDKVNTGNFSYQNMQSFKDQKVKLLQYKTNYYSKLITYMRTQVQQILSQHKSPSQIHNKLILLSPILWMIQPYNKEVYEEIQANYIQQMTNMVTDVIRAQFQNICKNIIKTKESSFSDLRPTSIGFEQSEMEAAKDTYFHSMNTDKNYSPAKAFVLSFDFCLPLVDQIKQFSLHFFTGSVPIYNEKNPRSRYVQLQPNQTNVNIRTGQLIVAQIFGNLPELFGTILVHEYTNFYHYISMYKIIYQALIIHKDNPFLNSILIALQRQVDQNIKKQVNETIKWISGTDYNIRYLHVLTIFKTFPTYVDCIRAASSVNLKDSPEIDLPFLKELVQTFTKVLFELVEKLAKQKPKYADMFKLENYYFFYKSMGPRLSDVAPELIEKAKELYDQSLSIYSEWILRCQFPTQIQNYDNYMKTVEQKGIQNLQYYVSKNAFVSNVSITQRNLDKNCKYIRFRVSKHISNEIGLMEIVYRYIVNTFVKKYTSLIEVCKNSYGVTFTTPTIDQIRESMASTSRK